MPALNPKTYLALGGVRRHRAAEHCLRHLRPLRRVPQLRLNIRQFHRLQLEDAVQNMASNFTVVIWMHGNSRPVTMACSNRVTSLSAGASICQGGTWLLCYQG